MRVLLAGASGSIGRATAAALVAAGHETVALLRPESRVALPADIEVRRGDVTEAGSLARDLVRGERFDAVISCLASRRGAPKDSWRVDYGANAALLAACRASGAAQFVLLSAICVQKPRLQFQFAKQQFEQELAASGLRYSIVRPTAYFKSLSGQVERVRQGKPFLVFGDGRLTACTPISDADVARFLVECLTDPARWNAVLPVGGPGPALTPRAMGAMLFELTGQPMRFREASPQILVWLARILGALGWVIPPLRDTAEFLRIGHYYGTESMLVWDEATGRYDEAATPQYGRDTLRAHYERLLRGEVGDDRGAHAVF